MDTATATERALTEALAKRPEIKLAYLFGSLAERDGTRATAPGRRGPRPDSDVDVAVAAMRPIDAAGRLALTDDIAMATGRPVDLVDLHAAGPLVLTLMPSGVDALAQMGLAGLLDRIPNRPQRDFAIYAPAP